MSYENINSIGNTIYIIEVFFKTTYVSYHANKSNSINLIWI